MDRDEQRSLAAPRANWTRSPSGTKRVVGAGHEHAVFAGLLDLVAQHQRELEDDGLLHLPARRPGPVVDAAMAGIDHHERARIAGRPWCPRGGSRLCAPAAGPRPRWRAGRPRGRWPRGRRTRRAGWSLAASITNAFSTRAGRARSMTMREPPCMTRPKRNALIRPRPGLPGLGREPEGDLRHVHHHPIGIGEREGAHVDLLAQIDRPCASGCRRRRAAPRSPPAHHSTAGTGGAAVPGRSAADAPPRTIAPKRNAKLVARTDMVFQPCELVLLQYGGTVNPNLTRNRPDGGGAGAFPLLLSLPSPAARPNKRVLTVYSSGCATFGHPAGPPQGLLPDTRWEGFRGRSRFRGVSHRATLTSLRPMFLWTITGIACGTCLPRRRAGLCFRSRFELKIVSQKNSRPRMPCAAAPSRAQRSMLRPRTENLTDRCQRNMASGNDAVALSAAHASLTACLAPTSRAHTAHPFNHHQTGFRSRRLAPPMWRRTAAARRPVIKRLFNAQQNAHRCDPSGGDPGGCSTWPPCRGIRLRVSLP